MATDSSVKFLYNGDTMQIVIATRHPISIKDAHTFHSGY